MRALLLVEHYLVHAHQHTVSLIAAISGTRSFQGSDLSALMEWAGMVKQLESMEHNEAHHCVLVNGKALAARARTQT